jgi:hypothetical protein
MAMPARAGANTSVFTASFRDRFTGRERAPYHRTPDSPGACVFARTHLIKSGQSCRRRMEFNAQFGRCLIRRIL